MERPARTVRERRRAETLREIKAAALLQLAQPGPTDVSLRGVAREVGMTVQSLYHYFENRDALLSALVQEAHEALADAVQAASDTSRGQPPVARRLAAAAAYRSWAGANRSAFLLVYGAPISGFAPVREGLTSVAAWRLAKPFAEVVFDGWTPEDLATVPAPPALLLAPPAERADLPLPLGALALFTEMRALMHGLVMLEMFGYYPLAQDGAAFFEGAMSRVSDDLDLRFAVARDETRRSGEERVEVVREAH